MCAWDVGNFNNDDAMDFINLVVIREGLKGIEATLDEILKHDYIHDDMGAEAIVGGEVVALLRGKPATFIPDNLAEWHQAHHLSTNEALTAKAIIAVERAWADNGKSGWRGLWEGSPQIQAVEANIMDLLSRLRS